MNPQNRGYPVPFVKHSVATGQLPPHQPQPPIVMDYQRLVEHMKAEFRGELQTFKLEMLAAFRAELQPSHINNSVTPQVEVSSNTLEQIERVLRRVLGEMGSPEPRRVQRAGSTSLQMDQPLYVPSDLLAPREGSVAVNEVSESAGNMDEAANVLRKVLQQRRNPEDSSPDVPSPTKANTKSSRGKQ